MIKPIETEYKGYRFRSRLEARWAVFFDACGVKWEYEPEGFDLGDGLYYLPDFLLHNVYTYHGRDDGVYFDYDNLWVEVKGNLTELDEVKLYKFADLADNSTLVLGNIPDGNTMCDLYSFMSDLAYKNGYPVEANCLFNFILIDGDNWAAYSCIDKKGKFVLVGEQTIDVVDEKATFNAYKKARQARFEYGEHGGIEAGVW